MPSFTSKASRARGVLFHGVLVFLVLPATPALLFLSIFVREPKRSVLWRIVAAFILRVSFRAAGIRLETEALASVPEGPVIFAANHGCHYDGFFILALLGRRAVLMTAPFGLFGQPLGLWMKNMGFIEVRRDEIDDAKYPRAHSKKQALARAQHFLKHGISVAILPEGHIEYLRVLHYFHTGAARLAACAGVPVVPVGIINGPERFPTHSLVSAGSIILRFGRALAPLPASALRNHTAVRKSRDELERHIVALLPSRYVPPYYHSRAPKRIGVFVDIDNTLYEGLSQVDLMRHLFFLHRVKYGDAMRAMYWLFLEKTHRLHHEEMMRRELLMLRGWDVGEFTALSRRAFERGLKLRIQSKLLSTLVDHAKAGHTLVLVTEIIHPLAKQFKKFLGAASSLDTSLEVYLAHTHRRFTGKSNCLCYKDKKADLVSQFAERNNINLKKSYGFGDSGADIPFLSLLGNVVAVNPDADLRVCARRHGWGVFYPSPR